MENTINLQALKEFDSLELLASQVVEGFITGLHKSPFHGFSVEFAEHRLYNSGESTRFIDWKLYGRTDKLFVKRYEEETNLRCQIVIDNSSSMYFPVRKSYSLQQTNKIQFSVYAAAAIMNMLRRQRDATGLSIFSDSIETHTQARSSYPHFKHLYQLLEKYLAPWNIKEKRPTSAASALHLIAESIHKRSLVVIFTDFFENEAKTEEVFSALQHLRHNKHEVILLHVTDKQHEIDFEFTNQPHRFIDMESGEEIKLNPFEIKNLYTQTMQEFVKEMKLRCAQYRIELVEADINMGFKQVLLPYLLKRQRLY